METNMESKYFEVAAPRSNDATDVDAVTLVCGRGAVYGMIRWWESFRLCPHCRSSEFIEVIVYKSES